MDQVTELGRVWFVTRNGCVKKTRYHSKPLSLPSKVKPDQEYSVQEPDPGMEFDKQPKKRHYEKTQEDVSQVIG